MKKFPFFRGTTYARDKSAAPGLPQGLPNNVVSHDLELRKTQCKPTERYGGFHGHGDIPIAGWFISWKILQNDFQTSSTGWWYTYPSEKYESQLGLLFPIYGKSNMFQTTNQRKITYVHRYNTTFLLRVSLFGKVLYLVFLQFPETDVRPLQVRWCRSFCSGSSGV